MKWNENINEQIEYFTIVSTDYNEEDCQTYDMLSFFVQDFEEGFVIKIFSSKKLIK